MLFRSAIDQGVSEEAIRRRLTDSLPMGRLAAPQEVAAVAHFLLSDAAACVSGANYLCDGGVTSVPL